MACGGGYDGQHVELCLTGLLAALARTPGRSPLQHFYLPTVCTEYLFYTTHCSREACRPTCERAHGAAEHRNHPLRLKAAQCATKDACTDRRCTDYHSNAERDSWNIFHEKFDGIWSSPQAFQASRSTRNRMARKIDRLLTIAKAVIDTDASSKPDQPPEETGEAPSARMDVDASANTETDDDVIEISAHAREFAMIFEFFFRVPAPRKRKREHRQAQPEPDPETREEEKRHTTATTTEADEVHTPKSLLTVLATDTILCVLQWLTTAELLQLSTASSRVFRLATAPIPDNCLTTLIGEYRLRAKQERISQHQRQLLAELGRRGSDLELTKFDHWWRHIWGWRKFHSWFRPYCDIHRFRSAIVRERGIPDVIFKKFVFELDDGKPHRWNSAKLGGIVSVTHITDGSEIAVLTPDAVYLLKMDPVCRSMARKIAATPRPVRFGQLFLLEYDSCSAFGSKVRAIVLADHFGLQVSLRNEATGAFGAFERRIFAAEGVLDHQRRNADSVLLMSSHRLILCTFGFAVDKSNELAISAITTPLPDTGTPPAQWTLDPPYIVASRVCASEMHTHVMSGLFSASGVTLDVTGHFSGGTAGRIGYRNQFMICTLRDGEGFAIYDYRNPEETAPVFQTHDQPVKVIFTQRCWVLLYETKATLMEVNESPDGRTTISLLKSYRFPSPQSAGSDEDGAHHKKRRNFTAMAFSVRYGLRHGPTDAVILLY